MLGAVLAYSSTTGVGLGCVHASDKALALGLLALSLGLGSLQPVRSGRTL